MDSRTPRSDAPATPPVATPNPHADEAVPAPLEGQRPGTDETVRPEQDEPGGPLGGLLNASAAHVAQATPAQTDAAEEALARLGVEEEGIESGQLLGFVFATLAAVAVLAVVLIWLIYTPFRDKTEVAASDVSLYPELHQSRIDAAAKLEQSMRADSAYTIPVTRAMTLVVAGYGGTDSTGARARGLSRGQFNELMVPYGTGRTVQRVTAARPDTAAATAPARTPADDEVGVDDGRADTPPTALADEQD